ncbi:family 10 glycosylhydrolase [Cyanobium gracile]|uniref:Family 10 glycosylhydrolase n=1 Tax=Cyanobium gracile UHCC 0281 TaxID=3110309 RepID=A0ABU5SV56_9CYAN|nr:family 10 glycosylhydrolase [Cyanobium gracile]MEA5442293.1 family 10 glycosylhydrolase [Cyanobium gracile UHCC 0281]
MTRHGPLRWIALVLCGCLLSGLLSGLPQLTHPALAQEQPVELRGVWFTANDMPVLRDRGRMQAAVNQLADLGFNRLYPVVWNGGFAYYPSRVSEVRQLQDFTFRGLQGQDILAEVINAGRRRGLKVIPWFEFGFMAPPDSPMARRHRSWLTQKRDGGLTSISAAGTVVWLNPFRPEVQQLITDLVLEVVNDWGADGIQFDDHMSLPREFGYDPFTTALYRKDTGKDPPANPEDPAWVKWRADRITAFMDQLARAVRAARPGAAISISPNYYDFAYKLQLQDWREWVRRGIADELLVQIYRPDLESYLPHLSRPEVQEARQRIPTAIAMMSGQRNRPTPLALIRQKVAATRAQGLGVAFFYFESLWSLGPESPQERIAGFAEWLGGPAVTSPPRPWLPPPPPLPPSL